MGRNKLQDKKSWGTRECQAWNLTGSLTCHLESETHKGLWKTPVWGWENWGLSDLPREVCLTFNFAPYLHSCQVNRLLSVTILTITFFWITRVCEEHGNAQTNYKFRYKIPVLKVETTKHRNPHLLLVDLIIGRSEWGLNTCFLSCSKVVAKDVTK